jgi:hypothetical protein
MAHKSKAPRGGSKRKAHSSSKSAKHSKVHKLPKKTEAKKTETLIPTRPTTFTESRAQSDYIVTVENIRGETVIGDLLVAFPRTREVLVRNGLKLEADDAGDIYITLDAFSALNGLKTEILVQDLVGIARESPLQQPVQQSVPQLAASPPV